jgi:hypothetical protein
MISFSDPTRAQDGWWCVHAIQSVWTWEKTSSPVLVERTKSITILWIQVSKIANLRYLLITPTFSLPRQEEHPLLALQFELLQLPIVRSQPIDLKL